MEKKMLNVAWLNGAAPSQKGGGPSGGGGVTIKNQSKSIEIKENGTTTVGYDSGYTGLSKVDIAVTIPNEEKTIEITKNGTTEVVADNGFLNKVVINTSVSGGGSSGGSSSQTKWTGHADVEGLKAIGWTDEDISYYQENGVNWNEEEDQYHKVPEDNIAIYGVVNAGNLSTYKDRIIYLPKIDTSGMKDFTNFFYQFTTLVSIPMIDTSSATNMTSIFGYCYSLTCIPLLDTSNVEIMTNAFMSCNALPTIPKLNFNSVIKLDNAFNACRSMIQTPSFEAPNLTTIEKIYANCNSLRSVGYIDTAKCSSFSNVFATCYALVHIAEIDMITSSSVVNFTSNCNSITHIYIKNCRNSLSFNKTSFLTKDSILYLINNEAASTAITITLTSHCYTKFASDPDVVAALGEHPNISLAG